MITLMGMCGLCRETGMIDFRYKKDRVLVMEDLDWTFNGKMLIHKKCEPSISDRIIRSLYDKEDKKGVGNNGSKGR